MKYFSITYSIQNVKLNWTLTTNLDEPKTKEQTTVRFF